MSFGRPVLIEPNEIAKIPPSVMWLFEIISCFAPIFLVVEIND